MVPIQLRFFNWLADTLICVFIFILLIYLIFPDKPDGAVMDLLKLGYLIFTFLYYFLFEFYFQKTPAKFITNTRVVKVDSQIRASGASIFFRTLSRFIPLEAAYILFNDDELTLHDLISKTNLIKP